MDLLGEKRKNNDWAWVHNPKKAKRKPQIVPQSFYCTTKWIRTRDRKLSQTPYCEVSAHIEIDCYKDIHIDHIIPLNEGGAKFNPYNLMSISNVLHGRKTRLEQLNGGPLIEVRETESGLIPIDRDDIFKVLFAKKKTRGHSCEIVW